MENDDSSIDNDDSSQSPGHCNEDCFACLLCHAEVEVFRSIKESSYLFYIQHDEFCIKNDEFEGSPTFSHEQAPFRYKIDHINTKFIISPTFSTVSVALVM